VYKEIKERKWLLVFFTFIAVVTASCGGGNSSDAADDVSQLGTKKLLIFYSWPNAINDAISASDDVAAAAAEYAKYDYVVLNRTFGVSDCPQATVSAIINHPSCKNTIFFGYVDLGMLASSQRLDINEIKTRISTWNDMGVDGIFFDEYGYDYDVTRARQNEAIDAVHAVKSKKRGKMLSVIANAWNLRDVFSAEVHSVSNSDGNASRIGSNDYFLLESFFVSEGNYVDAASAANLAYAIDKMNDAYKYSEATRSMPLTITTNADETSYDKDKFMYSWYAAVILGAEGAGWGEYVFSADGFSINAAPFRERPSINFGSEYAGKITVNGNLIERKTNKGKLYINTLNHEYGFIED